MGSATWHCDAYLDVSPDDAFAWLTDFSSDDHSSDAYKRGAARSRSEGADAPAGASSGIDPAKRTKPSLRRVLSREGNVYRVEDTWGSSTFTSTVTADPVARTVRIQGGFGYEATWRATPEGTGTRLSVDGQMGRGVVGSILKLFEAKTQKSMQSDFDGHVEDMRETLAGKQARASP